MEKSKGDNKHKFLKDNLRTETSQKHKAYLGLDTPEDYFANSKLSILNKVKVESSDNKFLKEGLSDITEHHKAYLGVDLPTNYFKESKQSILDKIKTGNAESEFLKEEFTNISAKHKEYLGTDTPKNYFATSKQSILGKIKTENRVEDVSKKSKVFYLRPQFRYAVAASLVFLMSLSIWLKFNTNNKPIQIDLNALAYEDDVLVESLLIEDDEIDSFADSALFEEVVVKAEEKEQKLDDLILNSLIVEDSLLDNYIKDEMIETIIL